MLTDPLKFSINDWNSGYDYWCADTMGNYLYDNQMQLGCFSFNDDDGTVLNSLWLVDDTDVLLELTDDQINEYLPICNKGDPYGIVDKQKKWQ
jgi:hypothetical protein